MRQRSLLACLATMMLLGCGQQTPAELSARDMLDELPMRQSQGPQAAPAAFPAAQGAAPVLARLAQTWAGVKTLSAHYESWQTKGSEREDGAFKLLFKKPGRYRYEVEKASNPIKNGSTAVFDTRSGDMTARLGSIASIFPIRGTLEDARSKSVRGHRLDQGDYEGLVKLLLAPNATVRLVSAPGAATPVVGLVKPPFAITDELRLTIDPRTYLIAQIEHVYQGKIVSRSKITNIRINPTLGADKFEL